MPSTATSVQSRRNLLGGTFLIALDDLIDPKLKSGKRWTVEQPDEDSLFLEQMSSYRNALAAAQGVPLRKKLNRKKLSESMIAAQISAMRSELDAMFKALGPFPSDPEDEVANRAYAKRAIAWSTKHTK